MAAEAAIFYVQKVKKFLLTELKFSDIIKI